MRWNKNEYFFRKNKKLKIIKHRILNKLKYPTFKGSKGLLILWIDLKIILNSKYLQLLITNMILLIKNTWFEIIKDKVLKVNLKWIILA